MTKVQFGFIATIGLLLLLLLVSPQLREAFITFFSGLFQ